MAPAGCLRNETFQPSHQRTQLTIDFCAIIGPGQVEDVGRVNGDEMRVLEGIERLAGLDSRDVVIWDLEAQQPDVLLGGTDDDDTADVMYTMSAYINNF